MLLTGNTYKVNTTSSCGLNYFKCSDGSTYNSLVSYLENEVAIELNKKCPSVYSEGHFFRLKYT